MCVCVNVMRMLAWITRGIQELLPWYCWVWFVSATLLIVWSVTCLMQLNLMWIIPVVCMYSLLFLLDVPNPWWHRWLSGKVLDLWLFRSWVQISLWASCSHLCTAVTKQYNLVPVEGGCRSSTGKVTVGLVESNDSLPPGMSLAGWLPYTRISSGPYARLRVWENLTFYMLLLVRVTMRFGGFAPCPNVEPLLLLTVD